MAFGKLTSRRLGLGVVCSLLLCGLLRAEEPRVSDYDRALEAYREGHFQDVIEILAEKLPKDAGALNLLGWASLRTDDLEAAKRWFESSIEVAPRIANSYCGLGFTLLREGDREASLRNFEAGLALDPQDGECRQGKEVASRGEGTEPVLESPETQPWERLYAQALEAFRNDELDEAIVLLRKADELQADSEAVLTLWGWSHFRSREFEEARTRFEAASSLDPDAMEPRLGLARIALAQRRFDTALDLLEELAPTAPDDGDVQLALAEARLKNGDNLGASEIYRRLTKRGIRSEIARRSLEELYGLPADRMAEYGTALEHPSIERSEAVELRYRTAGDFLEVRDERGKWRRVFLKGANLGPARPGEFPSGPPRDVETYLRWLELMAEMNANMVRVYTLLPPAFYRALALHNESSGRKLWLLQEIWLTEREDERDLYERTWTEGFQREIRRAVDVVHGQADIPFALGLAGWGIYTADVSRWVFAFGVGREVEPSIVFVTNRSHPEHTAYAGRYVAVDRGSPAEVWFARMSDELVEYEIERYGTMRPVTLINWPPLDPMHHVTEATHEEERRIRARRGEPVPEPVTGPMDDTDVVALDIRAMRATAEYPAGLFSSFHVYTHWPDFLFHEAEYPRIHDHLGSNRYYGYLLDLKAHHEGIPLLIAEYGVATSWGIAHAHPDGWHNGGFSERAQARQLVRMTRNILDAGCAGGLVFAWIDEWWKSVSDYVTKPFQPPERRPFWLNKMDPEQHFGILGYRSPGPIPELRGDRGDWEEAQLLAESTSSSPLRRLWAFSDETYLYLRLDLENRPEASAFDWNATTYWIGLNTLPYSAGVRRLSRSGVGIDVDSGVNFLIELTDPETARILVAHGYNPNRWVENDWVPGGKRIWRKPDLQVELDEAGAFEEIMIEANRPRYGRDGSVFPPIFLSRSELPEGIADPTDPEYSSLAAWRASASEGMIELRIPWGLLLFLDPSSRLAFAGTDGETPFGRPTPGISVVALALDRDEENRSVVASLPQLRDGRIDPAPLFTWNRWNEVSYDLYQKASYQALREIFDEITSPVPSKGDQAKSSSR